MKSRGRRTQCIVFPYDLFGSGGTGAGAQLLGDALRELIQDNKDEKLVTRANAYKKLFHLEEISFANMTDYEMWQSKAAAKVEKIFKRGDFLFWISGNHLGVLPLYEALPILFPKPLIIQFDAHLDIYNLSDCTTELSHGNFLLHATPPLPRIINIGHRELVLAQSHIQKYYFKAVGASEVILDPSGAIEEIKVEIENASHLFVDLDCDVFDPAYFPGLSHPLPFGISPHLFLKFLQSTWSEKLVGLSISEFDPARDKEDRSLATLMWLLEFLLLLRHEGN